MAKEFVRLNTRIDQWKDLFNDLTNDVGDIALLTTGNGGVGISTLVGSDSDLVTAVNELDLRLDSANTTQINSAKLLMRDPAGINTIKGHLDVEQTLDVTDSASFGSNVSVDGNTNVGGTLGVTGATTLRSTLDVTDSASLGDNVSVDGNANIGGTVGVTGATTLRSTLDVTDSASFASVLSVTGATTLQSTLDVTDSASLGDNVSVDGNTNLGGTLGVTGAATLRSTLDVTDSANFSDNVNVGGTLNVTGVVTADGGIDVDNMHLDGNGLTISSGDLIFEAAADVIVRPTGDNVILQGVTSGEQINITLGTTGQAIAASDNLTLSGGNVTIDASADINLDAAGNDVIFKDTGTQFGSISNVGGQLKLASVNGQYIKFTSQGVILNGIIKDSDLTTTSKDVVGAINDLKTITDLLDSAQTGNAALVVSQIGDLSDLTTTDKSNLVSAINEVNADVTSLDNGFDARARGLLVGGNAITYTSSTGNIAVTSNAIQADELAVTGNGAAGDALVSDGDGTFSWGKKVPGLYNTAGTLLN